MKQFYETYHTNKKLSLLVREIGWTNNMLIVSQTKSEEEKEFYIKLTIKENYSKNELSRQLESGIFERYMLSKENISPVAIEIYPHINEYIRDYYSFEFLGLNIIIQNTVLKKLFLQI